MKFPELCLFFGFLLFLFFGNILAFKHLLKKKNKSEVIKRKKFFEKQIIWEINKNIHEYK